MVHKFSLVKPLILAVAFLSLASCATAPVNDPIALEQYKANNDPLEPMNRKIFAFNMFMDKYFLEPVAKGYRAITSEGFRRRTINVLDNVKEPVTAVNDTLQGEFKMAGVSLSRFAVNTTVGLAGIYDPASSWGLEKHKESFNVTLAKWGVSEGPYLVLPFIGSSSPRGVVGLAGDYFANPINIAYMQDKDDDGLQIAYYGFTAADVVTKRESLIEEVDDLRRNSIDMYASTRSIYRQLICKETGKCSKTTVNSGNASANYEDMYFENFDGEE